MRTRTKTTVDYASGAANIVRPVGWPRRCDELYRTTEDWTKIVRQTSETMEDEEPIGGAARPERRCHHWKQSVTLEDSQRLNVLWGQYQWAEASTRYFYTSPGLGPSPAPPTWELPDLLADLLEEEDPAPVMLQSMPFLGELKSTIDMVRRPLSFLKKLRVPRGMRQRPLGRVLTDLGLDRASNAWLQYQYGWAPLIGDLNSVAVGCADMHASYLRYMNGSGQTLVKRQKSAVGPMTSEMEVISPDVFNRLEVTQTFKVSCQYRLRPAAEVGRACSYPSYVAKRLGFNPQFIALTAWELLPYSFVVDWFIPVGDFLTRFRKEQIRAHFDVVRQSTHYTSSSSIARYESWAAVTPMCGNQNIPVTGNAQKVWTRETKHYYRNWVGYTPSDWTSAGGLTTNRALSALSLIAQRLIAPH